ncbi:MAG: hypothetical protein K0U98_07995 [Deltaproteobacteria bacterium]|nr:hypothetical protein [Deltaproteobacteria bacterium]
MSKSSIPVLFSIFGVIAFAALMVPSASGDITSTRGLPVDGEISGVISETHMDESGLSEVYIESDDEELGTLVLTNGDPAMGANDLEQFGAVLESGVSCGGHVVLQAMNGNLIGASFSRSSKVICCDASRNRCFKASARSCATKGTPTDPTDGNAWTSMKDCEDNCK